MISKNNIIDVNEIDFEYEVIAYSQNSPVLVDFWAEWCQPCKTLSPMLEKLITEQESAIRLARVNVDKNPNLAEMYNVRNLPTVKVFTQGHVVAEFTGLQPEQRLQEFISKITPPSAVDLEIEKGGNLLNLGKWKDSEETFCHALQIKPGSGSALLGLSKSLLAQGKGHEALAVLSDFPSSREYSSASILTPLAQTLVNFQENVLPKESDLDTAFQNSIRLAGMGKIEAALDGLLDLLRQDKRYRNDLAKQVVISLLEILGSENPQTRQYRIELSSILF